MSASFSAPSLWGDASSSVSSSLRGAALQAMAACVGRIETTASPAPVPSSDCSPLHWEHMSPETQVAFEALVARCPACVREWCAATGESPQHREEWLSDKHAEALIAVASHAGFSTVSSRNAARLLIAFLQRVCSMQVRMEKDADLCLSRVLKDMLRAARSFHWYITDPKGEALRTEIVEACFRCIEQASLNTQDMGLSELLESTDLVVFSGVLRGLSAFSSPLCESKLGAQFFRVVSHTLHVIGDCWERETGSSLDGTILTTSSAALAADSGASSSEKVNRAARWVQQWLQECSSRRSSRLQDLNSLKSTVTRFLANENSPQGWDWSVPTADMVSELEGLLQCLFRDEDFLASCRQVDVGSQMMILRFYYDYFNAVKLCQKWLVSCEVPADVASKYQERLCSTLDLVGCLQKQVIRLNAVTRDIDIASSSSTLLEENTPKGLASLTPASLGEGVANPDYSATMIILSSAEIFSAILEALTAFHKKFGNLPGSSTAEMVVNFLVSLCENPLFRSKFSEGLFKAAQDCIVNMLSVDWRLSNTGLVSQVIFRISQMLDDALPARGKKYDMHDPGEGVACSVACNLIRLLSRISVHLNVASITDNVVNTLAQIFHSFSGDPTLAREVCLELARVAARAPHSRAYEEVVNLFWDFFDKPFSSSNREHCLSLIPSALQILAKEIQSKRRRNDFRGRLFELFSGLGLKVQIQVSKIGRTKASGIAGHLGMLLPSLSEAVYSLPPSSVLLPSNALRRSFRQIWFYCVLYGFAVEGQWMDEWYAAMLKMSVRAPVLVAKRNTQVAVNSFLETEQELNAIIKHNVELSKNDVFFLRQQLASILPSEDPRVINRFNFAECVFLLSIYHLESLRVRSGSLEALFAYLDDESLFSIGSLYSLVGKITDEVFTVFLEEVDVQLSQHTHLSKSLNLEDKGDGFSPLMADNPLLTSPAGGAPASAFLPNGRLSAVSSASLPPAERVDSSPRRCSSSSLSSGPSTPVTAAAGAAVVTQWKQQPVHDSSRPLEENTLRSFTVRGLCNSAAMVLLTSLCARVADVRKRSSIFLTRLYSQVPCVLWDPIMLGTLMDLIRGVGAGLQEAKNAGEEFSFEVPTLETINGAPVVISLLDSEDERLRVLETLLTLCKQWIERTLEMAPLAVQSSLYDYMTGLISLQQQFTTNLGLTTSVDASPRQKEIRWAQRRAPTFNRLHVRHGGATLIQSLCKRNRLDQPPPVPDVFHWSPNSIAGGLDADLASVSSGGSSCESSLEVPALVMMNHSVQQRQLCVQYSSILTSLSHKLCRVQARNSSQLQVLRDPQSMSTFIDVLERASLLLIEQFQSSGRFDRGLLRIVAGTPVRIFSQQVLDVACHCWSWIMSEAPEMAVDLMNMIEQSWTWMRERKLAIFSHRAPEKQVVEDRKVWKADPSSDIFRGNAAKAQDVKQQVIRKRSTMKRVHRSHESSVLRDGAPMSILESLLSDSDLTSALESELEDHSGTDADSAAASNLSSATSGLNGTPAGETLRATGDSDAAASTSVGPLQALSPTGAHASHNQEGGAAVAPSGMTSTAGGAEALQSVLEEDDILPQLDDFHALRVWIKFLQERFEVVRYDDVEQLHLLYRMVDAALDSHMSCCDEAMSCRFSLIGLSYRLLNSPLLQPDRNLAIQLRNRITSNSLHWFAHNQGWNSLRNMIEFEEELNWLVELSGFLTAEISTLTGASRHQLQGGSELDRLGSTESSTAESRGTVSVRKSVSFSRSVSAVRLTALSHVSGMSNAAGSSMVGSQASDVGRPSGAGGSSARDVELTVLSVAAEKRLLHTIEDKREACKLRLLNLLVQHQIDRMAVWADPQCIPGVGIENASPFRDDGSSYGMEEWGEFVATAFSVSPHLVCALGRRFVAISHAFRHVEAIVQSNVDSFLHIPEAVRFLQSEGRWWAGGAAGFTVEAIGQCSFLPRLASWATGSVHLATLFMNKGWFPHTYVQQFVVRTFRNREPSEVAFVLPQVVSMLRYDHQGILEDYLKQTAVGYPLFLHQLIWEISTAITDEKVEESMLLKLQGIKAFLESHITGRNLQTYESQFEMVKTFLSFSDQLRDHDKESRTRPMQDMLQTVVVPEGAYLPTDPNFLVHRVVLEKCAPMKSAAKAPILVTFECSEVPELMVEGAGLVPTPAPRMVQKACIFKTHDDCRQDQLVLQVVEYFKKIFSYHDLPLYLLPYRVITTTKDSGIIEVIPNSQSRDQLGNTSDAGLFEHFHKKYGHPTSLPYERARRNFMRSLAAYSIVTYILNIKDRHNGNILIDEDGHLVHIDFGFCFDISPGKDIGFERAPFKLTKEMVMILGDSGEKREPRSEYFNAFVDLCIKGYLVCREHMEEVVALVTPIFENQLPCFKKDSLRHLRARFRPDMTASQAAEWMKAKVVEAYDSWFTVFYDWVQNKLEGINK